jgi:hypothetical protein
MTAAGDLSLVTDVIPKMYGALKQENVFVGQFAAPGPQMGAKQIQEHVQQLQSIEHWKQLSVSPSSSMTMLRMQPNSLCGQLLGLGMHAPGGRMPSLAPSVLTRHFSASSLCRFWDR